MKTLEYREGPEALENFKTLATAILQALAKKKKQPKKTASQETDGLSSDSTKRALPWLRDPVASRDLSFL